MNIPEKVLSISELTREIKKTLEIKFPPLWLHGELSGVVHHRSGHLYLTLKDSNAQISGVMWRSRVDRLDFRPEDGMKVLIYGKISVYEKSGRYQFDIEIMQPGGRGALAIEFEKLKNRLRAEGLFDSSRKKILPRFVQHIGVATSASGAAVRDIFNTLTRRGFNIQVSFIPVKVQGEGSSEEIARSLERFASMENPPEVIIVGRGGGSIEDLWAFNEEITVRAIANCPIPVVSAVGHETDTTLSDYAADVRAATPTAAAELLSTDRREMIQHLDHLAQRIARAQTRQLEGYRNRLDRASGGYGLRRFPDRLLQFEQRLDDLEASSERALLNNLEHKKVTLESIADKLKALSPEEVLQRGYSIVQHQDKVVRSAEELTVGDKLNLIFSRGFAETEVISKNIKQ